MPPQIYGIIVSQPMVMVLNVPKDREKGLYYYRMAAEKGSDAARAELSQIEGGR